MEESFANIVDSGWGGTSRVWSVLPIDAEVFAVEDQRQGGAPAAKKCRVVRRSGAESSGSCAAWRGW